MALSNRERPVRISETEEYIKIMEAPSTPPEGELKMAIVT